MFNGLLKTGEDVIAHKSFKIELLPLVVKTNRILREGEYDKRLEELKYQYGGPVVLLRCEEEIVNHM